MRKLILVLSVIALIVVTLSVSVWLGNQQMAKQMAGDITTLQNDTNQETKETIAVETTTELVTEIEPATEAVTILKPQDGQPIKEFTIVAKESNVEIKEGVTMSLWTYNGTVPGTEIRVTQGDYVRVILENELTEPVTIHWHGYPVISAMDGIPGFTQDAVLPGETFIYEFSADFAGTYWYHSHQESAKQVDKGLYGALIVEAQDAPPVDKDVTLILDEWMENPEEDMDGMSMGDSSDMDGMSVGGNSDMGNMDDGSSMNMSDPVQAEEDMMASLYNIYTVNGRSGNLIEPIDVKKGDIVRLRFINAGYRSHGIHIPGQDIKVVSTDGQEIDGASIIKDQILVIAPGERYDVEFTAQGDNFIIDVHDENLYNDQLNIPVNITDGSGKLIADSNGNNLPTFDFMNYGTTSQGEFTLDGVYDVDQRIELNTSVTDGKLSYTINGEVFSELHPLTVKTSDLVKLTYENMSTVDHPMHLHGHFFMILSKNGIPYSGAPIWKDTLLIKPGEKYVVAFKADNPGIWVQHCHELHHATAGMMQKVIYSDYTTTYIADPNNKFNKAE